MNQYEKIFATKLQKLVEDINEIEEIAKTNSERQSKNDSELSDWLHELQNNDELNDAQIANIGRKIKELRKERESLKYEWELVNTYNQEKSKLMHPAYRDNFIKTIQTKLSVFGTAYKNRVITDEQLKEVEAITIEQKRDFKIRGKRGRKHRLDWEEVYRLADEGKSQLKIAEIMGCSQGRISSILKERNRGE